MSPSLFSPGAPGFRAESTYSFPQPPLDAQHLRQGERLFPAGYFPVTQATLRGFLFPTLELLDDAPTRKALLKLSLTRTMSGRWE